MYPFNRFIQCYSHHGRIGVLVEFGLETRMVTERADFLELSRAVAMHIAALNPESLEALLQQTYVKDSTISVGEALSKGSTLLGERISIIRFIRWDKDPVPPPQDPTPPKDPAVAMKLKRA
jgi:elongation factor Ts